MRAAPLLAVVAVACATPSSSNGPSGGTGAGPAADAATAAGGAADAGTPSEPPSVATAVLEPRSGSTVSGSARITPTPGGVAVLIEVKNATTPGQHGVHIHEKGDCADPAAMNAGAHFNPTHAAHHGGSSTPVRHAGDLGNINVDASGRGLLVVTVSDLSMENVVGRAVIVHEKVDDLQTDPAGNSGARVACGVIQAQ